MFYYFYYFKRFGIEVKVVFYYLKFNEMKVIIFDGREEEVEVVIGEV